MVDGVHRQALKKRLAWSQNYYVARRADGWASATGLDRRHDIGADGAAGQRSRACFGRLLFWAGCEGDQAPARAAALAQARGSRRIIPLNPGSC